MGERFEPRQRHVFGHEPGQVVVGFAAETGDSHADVLEHARAKLKRKGADLLVMLVDGLGWNLLRHADSTTLLGVLGLAKATNGAKSWIPLPGFHLQPSEVGKVLLVVALAGFLVERMRELGRHTTALVMLLGLLPTMIVLAEPDFGSATVYVAGTFALLFVAGAP